MIFETVDDQCVNDNLNNFLPPITEENENEGTDFDRESKRPRGTISKVWDHFTKISIKDGKKRKNVMHVVQSVFLVVQK